MCDICSFIVFKGKLPTVGRWCADILVAEGSFPTHSMKNLTRWLRARWRILPSLCRLHLAPDIEALGVQKKEIYGFSVNCEICSPLLALHPPSLWAISITFKFPVEFGRGGKSLIICHHRRYEESPVQFDSNILWGISSTVSGGMENLTTTIWIPKAPPPTLGANP